MKDEAGFSMGFNGRDHSRNQLIKFFQCKVCQSLETCCYDLYPNIPDTNGQVHRWGPSSISCRLNKSLVLEAIVVIIWKRTRSFWFMSSKVSSSLQDEVEWSLFEELEEDISQGLKWKKEGKEGRPLLYMVHMTVLIHILSTNLL
jgi:hypothetical protein